MSHDDAAVRSGAEPTRAAAVPAAGRARAELAAAAPPGPAVPAGTAATPPVRRRPPSSAAVPAHAAPRGRVPGWLWPVVCVLALVLGVLGGLVGGAVYEELSETPGTVAAASPTSTPSPSRRWTADNGSIAAVAQKMLPSTVQIIAEYDGQAGGATGSGFVLDRQGHVITNNHVVADAASDDGPIEVVDQDGTRYERHVVGRSPVYDLAVLYVPKARGLAPAALGSSRRLVVGEGSSRSARRSG